MTKKHVEVDAETGEATGKVIFTFDDNTTQTFDLSKVNEKIVKRLAIHGASQKVGDSYAGAAGEADPLAYAKQVVQETIAQLYAGDWRVASQGGGPRVPDLALALHRVTGRTLEDSIAFVETLDKAQVKQWKQKGKLAAALLQISAERKAEAAKRAAEKLAALKGQTDATPDATAEEDALDFEVPENA